MTTHDIIWPDTREAGDALGGKAAALAKLDAFSVPAWFAISPSAVLDATFERTTLPRALSRFSGDRFAVRSSAREEDGGSASYAGQLESYLYVSRDEIVARIRDVRASGDSERLETYRRERGRDGPTVPCAIVQTMIDADVAGVAFTRDPVRATRTTVISATYGLGPGVVSGDCACDTYRVAQNGTISERTIAAKTTAHRRDEAGGTLVADVAPELANVPALDDARVREVAALAERVEKSLGYPVDIEWAFERNALYLLQARPITTHRPPVVWDNANISESYGGVTSPLTYSFARYAYEGAYRQMLRMLGVSPSRIAANRTVLANLVGLVRGRIYYNLLNWYRLLALVPGFTLNRSLMETMMGVAVLPSDVADELARATGAAKLRDARDAIVTLGSLAVAYARLPRDVARFHAHVAAVLAEGEDLERSDLTALVAEFRRLETTLLARWETPLVNDFFTMLSYGILRKLTSAWCGDDDGTLQNGLLCADGGMLSAEPAERVRALAAAARSNGDLVSALRSATRDEIEASLPPGIAQDVRAYLTRFGDRSDGELKLETQTLRDDPLPLYRAIGRVAAVPDARENDAESHVAKDLRTDASATVEDALRGRPVRRAIFGFVLRTARARIRDRESLRFERTLLFARVRRIFRRIGEELAARGALAERDDVFSLALDEVLGYVEGTAPGRALAALAAARKGEFAGYRAGDAPPDRLEVSDPREFDAVREAVRAGDAGSGEPDDRKTGLGCCPGVVTARVRVVRDPHETFAAGEILVAERTDPGWVILFPAAAGILVERGSLLSHAAIVSREMGIPSVVGIPGLTRWLRDGDLVRFDGRTGNVERLAP
jgi:phosphohistidine swiveling domain-containing protein